MSKSEMTQDTLTSEANHKSIENIQMPITGPFLATLVVAFGGYRTTMYVVSILAFASSFLFKFSRQLNSQGRPRAHRSN